LTEVTVAHLGTLVVIALARLNRPSLMVYGGTIRSGNWKGEKLNIVSAFEALGKKFAGTISEEDYKGVINNACPGWCAGRTSVARTT
jgi:dihydroxy-acid dehydratase